jgi:hypothetical protein
MSRARAIVVLFTLIGVGLVAASPSPATLLRAAPRVVLVTLLAHVAARGMSRFVLGYPSQRGGVYPPRTLRIVTVACVAFVLSCLLPTPAAIHRPWLAELGHLAVLAGAGAALARWCRSSEASPLHIAAGLSAGLAAAAALCSSGNEAMTHAAGVMMKLPQDAAVLWAAWHIAAIRR